MPLEGYPMSKPTRWAFVYLVFALVGGAIIAACATGGASGGGGDDTGQPMDAPMNVRMDSSVLIDAPKVKLDSGVPMADAFKPPPDAPPGSLFCTNNAQCTVAGQCCVTLGGTMGFCAPGTVLLGQCFPIN
jgi:hypothetical protein